MIKLCFDKTPAGVVQNPNLTEGAPARMQTYPSGVGVSPFFGIFFSAKLTLLTEAQILALSSRAPVSYASLVRGLRSRDSAPR
jgi:hypothetical protein